MVGVPCLPLSQRSLWRPAWLWSSGAIGGTYGLIWRGEGTAGTAGAAGAEGGGGGSRANRRCTTGSVERSCLDKNLRSAFRQLEERLIVDGGGIVQSK